MTLALALPLLLASLAGFTSATTGKPNDPPMIVIVAPPSTHGAISGLRSGSVPSVTHVRSHRTTVRARTNRT